MRSSQLLAGLAVWLFAAASAYAVGPPSPPELRLTAPASIQVDEADGAASLAVKLKIKSGSPDPFVIEVNYLTASATATEVQDFTPVSGTLTFTNHDLIQHVTVPIVDDNLDEPDEQFSVVFGDPVIKSGDVELTHDSFGLHTAVTIIDNDAPAGEIVFANNTFTAAEDSGSASVTFKRINGASGTISIDYFTEDNSAVAGQDYTAVASTVTWGDGDSADKTIQIPITDDGMVEPTEDFTVSFINPSNQYPYPVSASVNILDNDNKGLIEFSEPNLVVDEDGVSQQLTVRRSGNASGPASVDFATSDLTATAGVDYVEVAGTLSWSDGELGDKTFNVPIIDDSLIEANEGFNVTLLNPTGQTELGINAQATVTIIDDDNAGIAVLSSPTYTVDEAAGTVRITVQRVQGTDGPLDVSLSTSDGTATAGADYTGFSGTLSWPDGDNSDRTVDIPIIDDAEIEADETFSVTLTGPAAGQPASAEVTIQDNDEPSTLDFVDLTVTTNETGDTVTLTVTRSGSAAGAVTVDFDTADGTATANDDYLPVSGTLSWLDGELGGKNVNVTILDDTELEGDEDFTIMLSNVTGPAELSANPTVTVVITDNDPADNGEIVVNNTPLSVAEDGGVATITVSRVNGSSGQLEATYATADSTATAGEDYTATSGSLVWADGDTADKSFTVAITDDNLAEGDEVLDIAIANVTTPGAAVINEPLTILDNDGGTLDFVDLNVTTNEAGDIVTLTVNRSGTGAGQVTVDFATADGSATAGEDYIANAGTLTWADGETGGRSVDVSIVDDNDIEGDEDFTISLSNVTGPASLGADPTVTVVITDNDDGGTLDFVDLNVTTNEAGDIVTLTVTRSGTGAGQVTVDFATADGSATAGEDYIANAGTLTWADGETGERSVDVSIVDDNDIEGDEDFTISLSNVTGPASLGADPTVTVVITDNDAATGSINFADPNLAFDEASGSATVTLSRENGANGELRVAYTTSNGTAMAGTDYEAASGLLVWTDGDVDDQSFNIPINDDNVAEGDETLTITLTDPDDPTAAAITADLTIVDNDQAANLEFLTSTVSTGEEAGTVTLTVTRTGSPPGALVIDFNTVDGSATAPLDYVAVSGTINWADGETGTRTIDIPITDDGVVEGDEVFTVNLVDRADPTAPPVIAIVTIVDNDVNADLAFTDLSVTTNERGDAVTVSVTRTGNATGPVSVDFATQDGSAAAGEDYGAASGTLSWLDGELGNRDITIPILDDNVEEADEDFSVLLANITGQASLGANDTITIIISASDGQREISVLPKLTPNQRRLANWFDKACPRLAASGNLSASQQDLNEICLSVRNTDTTDEELCDALDAILPNELFVASFNALRLTAIQHGNLSQRINALRNGATGIDLAGLDIEINGEVIAGSRLNDFVNNLLGGSAGDGDTWGRWGAFLDGRIVTGDKDKSDYEAGFDFDILGFTAGVDYRIKQNFIVGAAVGWGEVDSDFQRNGGGIDIDSISGAAFLTYFNDSTFYVDALATWGRNDYDSTRNIRFDTAGMSVQRKARGETEGDQYSFGVGTGWDFSRGPLTYGPHLGGYYFNVAADAFNETGAGGLELRVDEQRSESLTANVGGHISYAITTDWGVFVPNARLDWVKEFKDDRESLTFSFLHDPFANDPLAPSPEIKIRTDRPDPSYFIWSVGVHTQLIYGVSGFIDYKSYTSYDNVTLKEATWGLRWEKTW